MNRTLAMFALMPACVFAQKAQSASTFSFSTKDNVQTLEISNVSYEIAGSAIPGRPRAERLVLRKTTRTKSVIGDIDEEGSTTVEAWPLGRDFSQKPLYVLKVNGIDPAVVGDEVLQISRGLEEVAWWSIYKLGSGERLFDTYVPLQKFSISREAQTLRYVGLDAPPDDTKDARLKDPHVVAVLTYASAAKVVREVMITADDPKRAALLRSYADCSRMVEAVERDAVVRSLRLTIRQDFPSPPNPVVVTIPLAGDDLDAAHAQAPAGLHVAVWKR